MRVASAQGWGGGGGGGRRARCHPGPRDSRAALAPQAVALTFANAKLGVTSSQGGGLHVWRGANYAWAAQGWLVTLTAGVAGDEGAVTSRRRLLGSSQRPNGLASSDGSGDFGRASMRLGIPAEKGGLTFVSVRRREKRSAPSALSSLLGGGTVGCRRGGRFRCTNSVSNRGVGQGRGVG